MTELSFADRIALASAAVSILSLLVAIVSVFIAYHAIRKSSRHTSAATLVTLNEAFRQAWSRFLPAHGPERDYEFNELMNVLEIGCAIEWEGSLIGVSRELVRDYLSQVLQLLDKNQDARARILAAVHDPSTFKYISEFIKRERRRGRVVFV